LKSETLLLPLIYELELKTMNKIPMEYIETGRKQKQNTTRRKEFHDHG